MNILIDPYMLELEDEDEIRSNISFFRELCFLSKSNRISIHSYKGMVEKMLARDIKPFPIFLGQIRDEKLRESVKLINKLFISVVMNKIIPIDIETCRGDQNFKVSSAIPNISTRINDDEKYYELLSVLLQPCYNKKLDLSKNILTGLGHRGLNVGDEFDLECRCTQEVYECRFRFEGIEKFESIEDKAFIALEQIVQDGMISFIDSPEIIRGKHHNFLQRDSNFTTYEGLSRINKSVISLLRKFGLRKVIFGEFHEDSSLPQGEIVGYDIQTNDDTDIIKGWLYAETGYRNHVDMYFPKSVGENLQLYLGGDFSKNSVGRLIDSIL